MKAFVTLNKLTFSYDVKNPLFDQFSSSLLVGRVLGLLGSSGTGKTSLLRLLSGLETPRFGTIQFSSPTPVVSLVSQDPVLFEHYSRYENALYRSNRGSNRDRFKLTRFKELARVLSLDDAFLDRRRPLAGMSGGQRQRLILLRELSITPDLLLLDEPCTGLDPTVKREFLILLAELLEELRIKCVYATHHFDEVLPIADEIMYLHRTSDQTCQGITQTIKHFLSAPPTPEAAVTFLGPLATTIRGHLVPGNPHQDNDFQLATESLEPAEVLVLSSNTVRPSFEGFSFEVISRSGSSTIVSMSGQRIIVPTDGAFQALILEGSAYLFSGSKPVRTCMVQTARIGSAWKLRVLQS